MTAQEQPDEDSQVQREQGEASGDEPDEASLDELMARKSQKKRGAEEEDESILSMDRDDRGGTLPAKVTPKQATEFVCKKCFLVKHQSQLADKKRMLCKDCA